MSPLPKPIGQPWLYPTILTSTINNRLSIFHRKDYANHNFSLQGFDIPVDLIYRSSLDTL
jgi:hypothetical protein